MAVPLIDLFVSVSVVVLATSVSVSVGSVSVPVFRIWAIVGVVRVNPATVVAVPPRLMLVDPTVIELLDSAALGMFENVFDAPDIVLLVRVCVPVNVATVESMLMVFATEPSNVVPLSSCKPVPTVKAAVVAAVIVPDAPSATVTPL